MAKCLFHRWDESGCICLKCGTQRHDWQSCVCRRCGIENHMWFFCRCIRCGTHRQSNHLWGFLHENNGFWQLATGGIAPEVLEKLFGINYAIRAANFPCDCLLCQTTEHEYEGCRCKRCRSTGSDHRWVTVAGQCREKCETCGRERDVPCSIELIPGQCSGKCAVCGKKKGVPHIFEELPGKCLERCSRCGYETENHDWQGCVCRVCGAKRDLSFAHHTWQRVPGKCLKRCATCGEEQAAYHEFSDDFSGCVCKKCGLKTEHNYETYLSFDNWGEVANHAVRCSNCGHESMR